MSAFKSYRDWVLNSNEAGLYREAMEVNDRMPMELRGQTHEIIYRASAEAWRQYQREHVNDP